MSLWLERNGYFDAQGYCFASPLGQAYFGNSGCTTETVPTLPPAQARRVEEIEAQEARLGCRAQREGWSVPALRAQAAGGIAAAPGGRAGPTAPEDTRAVQGALGRLGLYRGAIDGVPGPGTSAAIRDWQSRQGTSPTGTLTEAQRQVLLAPSGSGGIVVPIGGTGEIPDFLLVAALARLPDFARHAPLRALISEGRLSGFFAYAPDAARDDDAVARIAAEISRVAPPLPERITLTLPAQFDGVDRALAERPDPITAPLRVKASVPDGFKIAPFAAIPLLGGAVRLDLELENAPRLGDVLLSPQEAEAARLQPRGRFGRGTIRVDLDVRSLGPSAHGPGLHLAGRVRRAEFVSDQGTGPTGRYVYRAAAAASLPPIRDFGELYETMAHLGRREGPAAEMRKRVPPRLDVQADDTFTILALRHASARLVAWPELLDDFGLAAPVAMPLLTWTERVSLLRGTDLLLSEIPDRGEEVLRALDPFERTLVADRFRAETRDLLAGRAFDAPLPARLVVPVNVADYDLEAERLRLATARFDRDWPIARAGQGPDAVTYRLDPRFALPTTILVPRAQAQHLMAGLSIGAPRIVLEFDLPPLRDAPSPAAQGEDVEMPVSVQRAVLYADPALRSPIHEFPLEAFQRREDSDAGPALQLQPVTRRQVIGTVLLAGGAAAEAVRDEIARRTPSHGLVRPEMRSEHAEELADRYRRDAEGTVLWVPAQIDVHDVDPGARRASIAFAPQVSAAPRGTGFENVDLPLGLVEGVAPRAVLVGALPLDDEMLRRMGFEDADGDRVFETLSSMSFDDLSYGTNALVRIDIASAEIGTPLRGNDGPALRIRPEIREVHLQLDERSWDEEGRLLVRSSMPANRLDAPATAQGIVVVRHADNSRTRPTGLLVSCLDSRLVPRALQGLDPVAMADTPAAVARFFSDFADRPVAWVTRADCLTAGLGAVPEGLLVHRPIHAEEFMPVETLLGAAR